MGNYVANLNKLTIPTQPRMGRKILTMGAAHRKKHEMK